MTLNVGASLSTPHRTAMTRLITSSGIGFRIYSRGKDRYNWQYTYAGRLGWKCRIDDRHSKSSRIIYISILGTIDLAVNHILNVSLPTPALIPLKDVTGLISTPASTPQFVWIDLLQWPVTAAAMYPSRSDSNFEIKFFCYGSLPEMSPSVFLQQQIVA